MQKFCILCISFCAVILSPIQITAQTAVKKPVFEKLTSTACGSCANADLVSKDLLEDYPNVIPANIHTSSYDPMHFEDGRNFYLSYQSGTPTGLIDRIGFPQGLGTWGSQMANRSNAQTPVAVSFETVNFEDATRTLDVTMKASFTEATQGDIRVNVYIVENNVTGDSRYDQRNYQNTTAGHPLYGMGHPIPNYVHQHVCRQMLGGQWGTEGVIPASVLAGEEFTHGYSHVLPDSLNENEMYLVAIVLKAGATNTDGQILNGESFVLSQALGNDVGLAVADQGLHIYPNPAQESALIGYSLARASEVTIEVLDQLGRVVAIVDEGWRNAGMHTERIMTDGIAGGVYNVRVVSENRISTGRLVVGAR